MSPISLRSLSTVPIALINYDRLARMASTRCLVAAPVEETEKIAGRPARCVYLLGNPTDLETHFDEKLLRREYVFNPESHTKSVKTNSREPA